MSTGLRAGTNNDGYLQVNGTDVLTALSSGNIGIGITNPLADIHLETSSYPTLKIQNTSTASGFPILQLVDTRTNGISLNVENGRYAGTFNIRDNTSVADRITLTPTGNVGIGTTNPGTKLDVIGSALISNSNPGAGGTVLFVSDEGSSTTSTAGATLRVANNGSNNTYAVFEASSSGGNFVITNANRVGIGVTDPQYDFVIANSAGPTLRLDTNTGASNAQIVLTESSGSSGSNGAMFRYDGANNRLDIGCGTNWDAVRLRVDRDSGQVTTYGRNVYFSTDSNVYAGVTIKKAVDGFDYLQLRSSDNTYKGAWRNDGSIQLPAGAGIDFSLNSNASGATSELLDDYEEGTWTPIVTNLSSLATFNAAPYGTGYYIKVGSKVTAWYYSSGFNVQSNGSGAAVISGFPFNSTNQGNSYAAGIITHANCFASDVENGYFSVNNNYFVPTVNNSTGSTSWVTGSTVYFMVSVTYWAA